MKVNHTCAFSVYVKRGVLLAFDVLCLGTLAVIALSGMPVPAYAYVDPSVMTYTIQAVAGVAVALSAVAGVAFRKSRRRIMKLLNIDENAKKTVDPIWSRVEGVEDNRFSGREEFEATADAGKEADGQKSPKRTTDNLTFPRKAISALLVSLFVAVTLLVMAPFETVAGASGDLQFRLLDTWWITVAFAGAAAVALTLLLVLVPKKAFPVVLSVVFAFALCCYIQAMFLNGGLPQADGRPVDWWGDHSLAMTLSTVLWLAVLAVAVVAAVKTSKGSRVVMCAVSIALVAVQCVGAVSLFSNQDTSPKEVEGPIEITETGLFDVSSKNNVIVLILDFYDTTTLERVASANPDMLDEMEGFTWYQNSAGVMIPTGFALPYLMTAQVPEVGQSVDDYLVTRWTNGTFLEDLKAANYSVGLYTPTFGLEYLTDEQINSEIYDYADNAHPLHQKVIAKRGTIKALTKAALYRDLPWVLKPFFRFYTDDINQQVVAVEDGQSPNETVYVMDDAKYFQRLKQFGLSIEDGDYNGSFRMIHLSGDHWPFTVNEYGEGVGEGGSSKDQQAVGSMHMVSYYLSEMKRLGVYDNSTIIITADHGDWEPSMDLPTMATSPILLYKPAHAESAPVKVSTAPVSHKEYFGTILGAMGQNYEKYGTTFSDYSDAEERKRDFFYITHDQSAHIHSLLGYVIDGDVNNFDSWSYTGEEWPCDFFNH